MASRTKPVRTRSLRAERNKRFRADCCVTGLVWAGVLIWVQTRAQLSDVILLVEPWLVLLLMHWMEAYDHFNASRKEIAASIILSHVYAWGLGAAVSLILPEGRAPLAAHGVFCGLQAAGMLACSLGLYRRFHNPALYRNPSLLVVAPKGDEARLRRIKYGVLGEFDAWYLVMDHPGTAPGQESQAPWAEALERLTSSDALCIFDDVGSPAYDILIEGAARLEKEIYTVPRIVDVNINHGCLTRFDDIPVLYLEAYRLTLWQRFWKRGLDLAVALMALAAAAVPMAVITLCIRLDSPGPVIYRQERYTKDKKVFQILKFRTMVQDAEKYTGPVFARKNDPRVTRVGRILRRFRLDELPQIFNILKGDMSLVGPRPERPFFVEQFQREIPQYDCRFAVKAGLTALSHVYGRYSTYIYDRTYYDLRYIARYSFLLDLRILLLTSKTLFIPNAAEGEDEYKVPSTTPAKAGDLP